MILFKWENDLNEKHKSRFCSLDLKSCDLSQQNFYSSHTTREERQIMNLYHDLNQVIMWFEPSSYLIRIMWSCDSNHTYKRKFSFSHSCQDSSHNYYDSNHNNVRDWIEKFPDLNYTFMGFLIQVFDLLKILESVLKLVASN